jgi:AraC-like DNA-binding protein
MNLFKKETGCTLGGYVTEKRLWLARSLLRQGVSINEACLRSGFANYANFYRAFKKRYGVSPREADRLPAETEH